MWEIHIWRADMNYQEDNPATEHLRKLLTNYSYNDYYKKHTVFSKKYQVTDGYWNKFVVILQLYACRTTSKRYEMNWIKSELLSH